MRHWVIRIITFVGGLFFLLEFVLPGRAPQPPVGVEAPAAPVATRPASQPAEADHAAGSQDRENFLTPYLPDVAKFLLVVGTMAFLLGPINLVRSHVKTLLRGSQGRLGSVTFLVFLLAGVLAASLRTDKPAAARARPGPASAPAVATAAAALAGAPADDGSQGSSPFDVLYEGLFFGVMAAFFAASMALLAFYLVSAAHRAFRLNSMESGLMMVAAVIVLLGQVPVGDWMTYRLPEFLQLRSWSQWILMFPNAGVQRAVLIGACGGAIAAAMRHWLGLGRGAEA